MKKHGKKSKAKRKDYKCDICGKKNSGLHNLNVHKRMHENIRPFGCSGCGQKFRYENYFFLNSKYSYLLIIIFIFFIYTGRKLIYKNMNVLAEFMVLKKFMNSKNKNVKKQI